MCNELSVLIPVFNVDIRLLVRTLHQQCDQAGIAFEIVCYDDGSCQQVMALNEQVRAWPHVRYERLPRHLGRAEIRNQLARDARYHFLLFLDNDSLLPDAHFIQRYLQAAALAPVLVGGTSYQQQKPPAAYRLRWQYGRRREERSANRRNQAPYRAFYLNNIFLEKSIFLRYPLQPLVREYGHEDSTFGRQLEVAGIRVGHLNNPVLHMGLEPADMFLTKSCQAIGNLYWLYRQQGMETGTRLVELYRLLKKFKLLQPFMWGYKVIEPLAMKNLKGPAPCLWLFDLYKLYYFVREDEDFRKGRL